MAEQELVPVFTVHCFFGDCDHVIQATTPFAAHDLMERHYTAKHDARISALIGDMS